MSNKNKNTSSQEQPVLTEQQILALKKKKRHRLSRRLKHGSFATVMIAAVIAVVIILNVVISVLDNIYDLSVDLTADQSYALSDEVKQYVRDNEKEFNVYMLCDEVSLTSSGYSQLIQLNSLLHDFCNLNDKINLEYVNIVNDPTFTANYPALELATYNILFDCNGHTKLLTLNDLFTSSTDSDTGETTYQSNVDQKLLSAMITVTADKHPKVAFLGGHEETTASGLIDLLEENGYEVTSNVQLSVITEEELLSYDALVCVAPTRDYSEEELKLLDTYLNNSDQLGKNFFYFADVSQPELSGMEEFLYEWGADVGSGMAAESDTNRVYYQSPYYPIASYVDEDDKYSAIFAERDVNLIMPFCRQLSTAFESSRNRTTITLLTLSETSYIVDDVNDPNGYDDATVKGNIPVAIVGDRAYYDDDGNYLRSDVFTIATSYILSESLLNNSSVLNGDYIINLFNRTLNTYDLIYIAPRDLDTQSINITSGQANGIAIFFAAVLPAAVLVCGLVVYLRRRHK